jgi:hypothetical protein
MRIILASITIFLLGSCSYKIVEGGVMGGIKLRESLSSNSSIIFGRVKVYDNSNNLSSYKSDIADSCIIFVGNDPSFTNTMFYRYNWPTTGHRANIYKGIFAIQLTQDFEKENLNIACGTENYLRKKNKIIFGPTVITYDSYLRMDMEKPIELSNENNKALYLGDIEISIPVNAAISNINRNLLEGIAHDFIGDYYRFSIKHKIDFSFKITDNFKATSKEIGELLPFLEKDFIFGKAILH